MCSPRKFHSKHSKHPKHSRLYQGRDSAASLAPIQHVLWLSYPMINDPAQPEGAKEARDSEADTSSKEAKEPKEADEIKKAISLYI